MNKKQYGLLLMVAVVAGLVGGVVSSWFLMGSPVFAQKAPEHEKVLQAERFEVVDQAGKGRAALSVPPDGGPILELFDQAGKPRLGLSVLPDGKAASLKILDRAEKGRVLLAVVDGSPGLLLLDEDGKVLWRAS